MKLTYFRILLSGLLMTTIGCSTVKPRVEKTGTTTKAAKVAAKKEKKAKIKKAMENGGYTVQKGDTLWDISSSDANYKDGFEWPLIFKANKGSIQDPDIILPDQKLVIEKNPTEAQVEKAQKQAHATPKAKPHAKPRATLPVNYDE